MTNTADEDLKAFWARYNEHVWNGRAFDDKALELAQRAVSILPDDPFKTLKLGEVYSARKEYDAAIAVLTPACTAYPRVFPLHRQLALTLLDAGRFQDAIPYLKRVASLDHEPAPVHSQLASCYLRLDANQDAALFAQRAVELAPKEFLYHAQLGAACARLGLKDQALDCAQKVVDLRKEDPFSYVYLALIQDRCGVGSNIAEETLSTAFAKSGGNSSDIANMLRAALRYRSPRGIDTTFIDDQLQKLTRARGEAPPAPGS